jgi:uncharacterized membrane protein
MSQAALKLETLWGCVDGKVTVRQATKGAKIIYLSHRRTFSAEVVLLGGVLILLQILDGILTGCGMSAFGTEMEGNPLLAALMQQIGYVPALCLVKAAAILLIVWLCSCTPQIRWVKTVLRGLVALYTLFAVGPWSYILTAYAFAG